MEHRSHDVRGRTNNRHAAGFSLIEIMIVVTIIGILAAIVVPTYTDHIIKSRREAGKACLMQAVQQAERLYTTDLSYANLPAAFVCEASTAQHYSVTRVGAAGQKTYVLQATPLGDQASMDTTCGALTVNASGAKTPTATGCW